MIFSGEGEAWWKMQNIMLIKGNNNLSQMELTSSWNMKK